MRVLSAAKIFGGSLLRGKIHINLFKRQNPVIFIGQERALQLSIDKRQGKSQKTTVQNWFGKSIGDVSSLSPRPLAAALICPPLQNIDIYFSTAWDSDKNMY